MVGCEGLPNGYRYTSSGVPGDRSAKRTQPWPAPAAEAADAAEAAEAAEAVATTGPPSRAVTAVTRTRRLPSLIVVSLHRRSSPGSTARQQPRRARCGEVNAQCCLPAGQADNGGLGGLVGGALEAHHGERRGQVPGVRAGDGDLP